MTTLKLTRWNEVREEQLNTLLSRRVISGERAMVAQITLKKGCVVPEHSHESEQISWVFKGALQFTIGGEQIVVREGEVLCIPSHVPHAAIAIEDCFEMDVFSPIRRDWLDGTDAYLRK
ncbi:MAG: cupin domain-containing protein [Bacteroidales bacterium]